ncbi:MAG TPA: polynucleotide kinase-phosphatase, partial [Myxococcota bacterium]
HVLRQQAAQLKRTIRELKNEGFRYIFRLRSADDVDTAVVVRRPLWSNKKDITGPFDIIGDVHGCFAELVLLLRKLGYDVDDDTGTPMATPPSGRTAVFVGDLVDRSPASPAVLKLVMAMVQAGHALCVPGNHEDKLKRFLLGKQVTIKNGLEQTVAQLANESDDFKRRALSFIDGLVSHVVLDDGRLVVAHAGMKQAMQGRGSGAVRQFALYGETTGETDAFGLPVRYDWASEYRGSAMVVYGHTPVPEATWLNNTICVDTGCVFGGALTALRYPERELVDVPALAVHYAPAKPLAPTPPVDNRPLDLIDIDDVAGKRHITTRLQQSVTIRAENSAAALETMSRFAVDPQWLIYLPPTMSPSETCSDGPLLEHPREAFGYFKNNGVDEVICEEKHMGSRAVVVVCRDAEVGRRRFRAQDGRAGVVVTRTGRPFFNDDALEAALLAKLRTAVDASDLWRELDTDWLCLDTELLPWSAKAQDLLRTQYAPVGTAATAAVSSTLRALEAAAARGVDVQALLDQQQARASMIAGYDDAWHRYCWPVNGIDGLRLAPFHLLASEGKVHVDKDHLWHLQTLARLAFERDSLVQTTKHLTVRLDDDDSVAAGIAWWQSLVDAGGEGMVVKPLQWNVRGGRGLVQPALKCRGPEYLRLIYGPEYTTPAY